MLIKISQFDLGDFSNFYSYAIRINIFNLFIIFFKLMVFHEVIQFMFRNFLNMAKALFSPIY